MALVLVKRLGDEGPGEVIINSDMIFECHEEHGGVRVNYTNGTPHPDSILVRGTLMDFLTSVGGQVV